jgi:hypothetical protein
MKRGGLNPEGGFDIRRLLPQNPYINVNPAVTAAPVGSSTPMSGSTLNIRVPGMPPAYADGGMVPPAPSAAPPQAGMAPQQPGLAPSGGAAPQRMSLQQLQQEAQKFAQANPQAIQLIRESLMEGVQSGDVTPQQITMLVQMAVAAAQNPELYPRLRQMAIQQQLADEEDLPMEYDQGIVFSLIVAGTAMQQSGGAMQQAPGAVPGAGPAPPGAPPTPGPQGATAMMKEGGHIPMTRSPTGDNTGRADDIPIRVSGGEYVIPKHVVERKGTEFFDKLIGKDKGVA